MSEAEQMLKIVDVEIDSAAIIPCPLVRFKGRYAAKCCPGCDNFKGIGLMVDDPSMSWHERYTVRCAHIIERRTQIIEVVD